MRPTIAVSVLAAALSLQACGTDVPKLPYAGTSPEVYVAKVKDILVGLPPTDAEIAQVVKDPSSLSTLVTGWMQTQQYQDKMKVFFELAFQQTQITAEDFLTLIPPDGIGGGHGVPLLVQNATESFARTALELDADGRPLTDAFTTHTFMMTTALMEFYAFLDQRPIDDNGNIVDLFQNANPNLLITMQYAAGQPTLQQSVSPSSGSGTYMHWYVADLATFGNFNNTTCDNADPVTAPASAMALHELLYGEVPTHKAGTASCPSRTSKAPYGQMMASDFTDWRMVTVSRPSTGQGTTTFFDIPMLRTSNTLVLNIPRVGYFSTPAYFANWQTNTSNMDRVTANQALIVATGAQVDGTDSTTPATTPGLDSAHAQPGTACFGCHQLLDPTRSILSATYSYYYYPQTDATLIDQPGQFAFEGVIAPVHTVDDFAQLLATHPLVPGAWAQKLCYYANSAPCDPSDPVFQKIVTSFANTFSWDGLVHDLLVSPITTNAQDDKTIEDNGEIISVARSDHLCAALNNRLGFVDLCGLDQTLRTGVRFTGPELVIQQIVNGLPSDGYGRGATLPVLPNQPTLFYRGGLENICEAVSQLTVDAPAIANQPGAKQWSSSQPDAAIADFVGIVMGLTATDPRASEVNAALQAHFTQATQTGANATNALQSTFVAACLSPSFIGIGM